MSIEELEKRERDAYEAFMEADWMHADMRLNEWLDAAHELLRGEGAVRRRSPDFEKGFNYCLFLNVIVLLAVLFLLLLVKALEGCL